MSRLCLASQTFRRVAAMQEVSFCTICGADGYVLSLEVDGQMFASCLCGNHDILCIASLMEENFDVLADVLLSAAPEGTFADRESAKSSACLMAIFRAAALGLSSDDVKELKLLEQNLPEDALDVEMCVLSFLSDRNLL